MGAPRTNVLTVGRMMDMKIHSFHRGAQLPTRVFADESGLPELDAHELERLAPLFEADDLASRGRVKNSEEDLTRARTHLDKANRSSRLQR